MSPILSLSSLQVAPQQIQRAGCPPFPVQCRQAASLLAHLAMGQIFLGSLFQLRAFTFDICLMSSNRTDAVVPSMLLQCLEKLHLLSVSTSLKDKEALLNQRSWQLHPLNSTDMQNLHCLIAISLCGYMDQQKDSTSLSQVFSGWSQPQLLDRVSGVLTKGFRLRCAGAEGCPAKWRLESCPLPLQHDAGSRRLDRWWVLFTIILQYHGWPLQ